MLGDQCLRFRACRDQCPVVSVRWVETDLGDDGPSSPGSGKACLVLASSAGDVCRFSPIGTSLGHLRCGINVLYLYTVQYRLLDAM